jgi:hypothetical protein
VTRFGPGRGTAVFLLNELRAAVAGLEPLPSAGTAPPHWDADDVSLARFSHVVLAAAAEPELARIMRVLGLSQTETAALFGVRRQAVAQWLDAGVPAARASKVTVVARVADLLDRMLVADRIPGIARTRADAYGGQSMLEMIAADDHEELLATIAASFDWSAAG